MCSVKWGLCLHRAGQLSPVSVLWMLSQPLKLNRQFELTFHALCGTLPQARLTLQQPNYFLLFLVFTSWLQDICLADSPEGSLLCLSVSQEKISATRGRNWAGGGKTSSNCWSDRGICQEFFQCFSASLWHTLDSKQWLFNSSVGLFYKKAEYIRN